MNSEDEKNNGKIKTNHKNAQNLIQRYIEICNQAIRDNPDAFPINQLIRFEGIEKLNNRFDIAVFDDKPLIACTLHYQDQKLIYSFCERAEATAWRLGLSHIQKVVKNPEDYIHDPDKLDLDWFSSRLA